MSAATQAPGRGSARVSSAVEDYLKAVYQLRDEAGTVTVQHLAEQLGVASPSVTSMVKRLSEQGLLRHAPYHGVALTEAGERIALEVVRHHRLLERYLVEALGYGWDEVHAEAERLEHHISEELEARMDAALGHPVVDPHGDPIPRRDGVVASAGEVRLLDLEVGEEGVVHRVSDRDPAQLRYLGSLGLYPGAAVAVREVLPFDGPIRIRVDGAEHVIGHPVASAVRVDRRAPHKAGPRHSGNEAGDPERGPSTDGRFDH